MNLRVTWGASALAAVLCAGWQLSCTSICSRRYAHLQGTVKLKASVLTVQIVRVGIDTPCKLEGLVKAVLPEAAEGIAGSLHLCSSSC